MSLGSGGGSGTSLYHYVGHLAGMIKTLIQNAHCHYLRIHRILEQGWRTCSTLLMHDDSMILQHWQGFEVLMGIGILLLQCIHTYSTSKA